MSRVERVFAPDVAAVSAARRFAASTLAAWELVPDDVVLVISELVTNAVCHAQSRFVVSLCRHGDVVLVEVTDASSEIPRPATPGLGGAGGRGLLIVDHLARSWGVDLHAAGGKVVWAEIVTG